MKMITQFKNEFAFLSNMHQDASFVITMKGKKYRSVEAAFQAAKTLDDSERVVFQADSRVSPYHMKKLGKKLKLRDDWEEIKLAVMESALKQKFKAGTPLADKLLATGDALLIEGNYWNDTFFGFSLQTGHGQNHLGRLLMKRRAELREASVPQDIPKDSQSESTSPSPIKEPLPWEE